eukprot:gene18058-biopygen25098
MRVTNPALSAARNNILNYFSLDAPIGVHNDIFPWDRGPAAPRALLVFFASIAKRLYWPIGRQLEIAGYLIEGEREHTEGAPCAGWGPYFMMTRKFPELQQYRDVCFYWKLATSRKIRKVLDYSQDDATLHWQFSTRIHNCFSVWAFREGLDEEESKTGLNCSAGGKVVSAAEAATCPT